MEVANLSVKLSADVENAISGLHKSDTALQKTAGVANKETKKITGFLGKMKMGWVMVGAAAITGLYAMAKSSAVLGSYLTEYGAVVGAFFDTIFLAFEEEANKIIDKMWELEEEFEKWPDWAKKVTGTMVAIAVAVPTAIIALSALKWALATLGITAGLSTAAIVGFAIISALAIGGFLVTYYTNWQGTKDKANAAIDEMRNKLSEFSPSVGNIFATIARYPGLMFSGKMLLDPEQTARTLESVASAIDNSRIVNAFRDTYNTIKTDVIRRHKEFKKFWKDLLKSAENIWSSIGVAIWKPIQSAYNKVVEYVEKILAAMARIPAVGRVTSYLSGGRIPSYQYGGNVPTTGLAMLHAGEQVIPAGGTTRTSSATTINYSPTFNITGEMRTDTDLRELANTLSGIMKDDVRRIIR